ncbi:hypothetical protein ACFPN1_03290 [Lysobacter yangpyeongensis]|uniref:Uncharacterized protein n=1 Tax=Lysobacter yangpyeongensis TaxID=346182 RepID=A0ABW0SJN7_9GAMM
MATKKTARRAARKAKPAKTPTAKPAKKASARKRPAPPAVAKATATREPVAPLEWARMDDAGAHHATRAGLVQDGIVRLRHRLRASGAALRATRADTGEAPDIDKALKHLADQFRNMLDG